MSNPEREDEAPGFIGQVEGDLGDAERVVDLDDDDAERPPESSDEEDEAGAPEPMDEEDDSIHTFEGHQDGVYAVAWCQAKKDLVATGGADDCAFIWRVGQEAFEETGGKVLHLQGHTDTVASLAFSHDGTLLATGGMDGQVRIWDSDTGACVQVLEGPGDAVEWVSWHPRGDVVLAGSADCTLFMWDARLGRWARALPGHTGPVCAGCWAPDGRAAVSVGGEDDTSLRVWDPKTAACVRTVSGHGWHRAGVTCVALSPDGSTALTGSEDGTAKVTALATGRVGATLMTEAQALEAGNPDQPEVPGIEAVAWVPAMPGIAVTASLDGALIIWDLARASPRAVCQHPEGITRLAVLPDRPLVVSACLDCCVRVWDARTGDCKATFRGFREPVQDLALSPGGDMVLAGSEDGTARVFSLADVLASN